MIAGDAFLYVRQALLAGAIARVEKQRDAAHEGEVGGIAVAGGVFAEGCVSAILFAVLDADPVGTAQVDPVFWSAILPLLAGKIDAHFLAFTAAFFDGSGAADF